MAKSGTTSTRSWKVLRNFADGSCAIYSLLQAYLFLHGVSPQDAQRAFTGNPTPTMREHVYQLVRLCREATVRAVDESDGTWSVETSGAGGSAPPAHHDDDLATFAAFRTAILNVGGWYDQRAIRLLAEILGIESSVQIVCKRSRGKGSWYETVDGSGEVRAPVLLLWSGRCHYECVVPNVSVRIRLV